LFIIGMTTSTARVRVWAIERIGDDRSHTVYEDMGTRA